MTGGGHMGGGLSAAFLAAHRARLDAIGPWTVLDGGDELDLDWKTPAALAGHGFPLDLRFDTYCDDTVPDPSGGKLDPDERMFELWELFRASQAEFVAQVLKPATNSRREMGVVESAEVLVARYRGADSDDYVLSVMVKFGRDREHSYIAEYDAAKGAFGNLEAM